MNIIIGLILGLCFHGVSVAAGDSLESDPFRLEAKRSEQAFTVARKACDFGLCGVVPMVVIHDLCSEKTFLDFGPVERKIKMFDVEHPFYFYAYRSNPESPLEYKFAMGLTVDQNLPSIEEWAQIENNLSPLLEKFKSCYPEGTEFEKAVEAINTKFTSEVIVSILSAEGHS